MKRFLLAALLPCVFVLPAQAQTTPKDRHATEKLGPADAVGDPEIKAVRAQMQGYGAWLLRLDQANAEATAELQNIQAAWRAMSSGPAADAATRFRPVIARAKAKVAEARQRVRALDTPAFPALELGADATPAALIVQVLRLYDRVDALLDSFGPLLAAMARQDEKAVLSSAAQMLDAAQLLLDTQAVLSNASLVTADRDLGAYHVILVQTRVFQSASRVMGAAKLVLAGKQDPALARDLERYADEIDSAAVDGRKVIDAKIALWDELVKTGDNSATQMLRQTSGMLRADRKLFDATGAYSAQLRATAARARAGRLVVGDVAAASRAFAVIRDIINTISSEENAAMAGS